MPTLEQIKQADSIGGTWFIEATEDKLRFDAGRIFKNVA
jgi:hypothetical protein